MANEINVIPEAIGVLGTQAWQHKDTSHIKDYQPIEKLMDWTFCTPYKGTIKRIDQQELQQLGLTQDI